MRAYWMSLVILLLVVVAALSWVPLTKSSGGQVELTRNSGLTQATTVSTQEYGTLLGSTRHDD